MNRELFVAAVEQKLRSPFRLILCAMIAILAGLAFASPVPVGGFAPFLIAVIATAGVLGREFSSGTPQLTFARPVRRSDYVLARLAAAVAIALAFDALLLAVGALVAGHAFSGFAPPFLQAVLDSLGVCAVVLGLSALTPGYADVVLLAAVGFGCSVVGVIAHALKDPNVAQALGKANDALYALFYPRVAAGQAGLPHAVSPVSVLVFVGTIVGWIALALWRVSRREITYATD